MSKANRLLVILAATILLPIIWYLAAPILYLSYMVFFGPDPGLACGDICSELDWVARDFFIGSIAAYVLIMGLGIWWVMKGAPEE